MALTRRHTPKGMSYCETCRHLRASKLPLPPKTPAPTRCIRGHEWSVTRRIAPGGTIYCNECRKINNARWSSQNEDRRKLLAKKHNLLKFGLTPERYLSMLADQNGLCALCKGKPSKRYGSLAVDHNHRNGRIRGLLCNSCNVALGHFRDSESLLMSAIAYLRRGQQ